MQLRMGRYSVFTAVANIMSVSPLHNNICRFRFHDSKLLSINRELVRVALSQRP